MKMKLLLNKTSPYSRAVRIVAMENGLNEQLELVWSDPWGDDAYLLESNPARKVPVLITSSGTEITESLLIACYFEMLTMSPQTLSNEREQQLQQVGLAQSLMDASFSHVICRKYDELKSQNSVMTLRRLDTIKRVMHFFSKTLNTEMLQEKLNISDIFVGVAVDYLQFRLPHLYQASASPELTQWHEAVKTNASFLETHFN